jgi:hypothetical protein
LFRLGAPSRIDWWAEGRTATRAEVATAIDSGYPILRDMARGDGLQAVAELEASYERAMTLLPAA